MSPASVAAVAWVRPSKHLGSRRSERLGHRGADRTSPWMMATSPSGRLDVVASGLFEGEGIAIGILEPRDLGGRAVSGVVDAFRIGRRFVVVL